MPADVIPASHRDLLDEKGIAHVASLGPRGEPQSHPVWYDFLEIRGRVTAIEDDPEKKLVDTLAQKYLGEAEYPYKQPDAERVNIWIDAEHCVTMG